MMKKPHIVPPCSEPITIVYQDEAMLVVEKPQPMLSTPGRLPENRDSLITRLQLQFPSAELVHRLDMATSGLMLIALSKPASRNLSKQFQKRRIQKQYHAILQGHVQDNSGTIDLPIITDWERRPLQKVCHENGKPSLTRYSVIERLDNLTTRILFEPVTGRSHQLRIHSLNIGHPILGCQLYKIHDSDKQATRLMLHASFISFEHPLTGKPMAFDSTPPF